MKNEKYLYDLLEAAKGVGISQAEVYYQQSESMRIDVEKGEIDNYAVNATGGVSLRGLVDGKMGAAYSEALDRDARVMMVRGVLESAALVNDRDEQFIYKGSPSYAQVSSKGYRGTPQQRIDMALALDEFGRTLDPRVGKLGHVFVQTERETVRLVNTHGVDLTHEADYCVGYVSAIARQGESIATGGGVQVAADLAALDVRAIAQEAVDEAVMLLGAAPCESGEMPVIFRNTAMADILGTFCGLFSAEAAQKGLSLLAGKEGKTIAAPCVTIVDDPLLAGGVYSRPFDGEGVAAYTKNLVEGGVLKTLMHNLKTAKKAGAVTTGNAARGGYAGPVGIAPSNLLIKPGEAGLDALCGEMGRGLVITDVEGLHAGANAVSGDFSLLAKGYLVENGASGRPVERVTVAGNFFALLKDIQTVGSDIRGDFGRVRCPSVLVKALSVAGK